MVGFKNPAPSVRTVEVSDGVYTTSIMPYGQHQCLAVSEPGSCSFRGNGFHGSIMICMRGLRMHDPIPVKWSKKSIHVLNPCCTVSKDLEL